ncbi:SCO family protein [Bacillus sp. T33-2]|uniref:SCO family protein n=1 Tax=Bacillus sp. T33-2 TaxID=2054168 RepID=UPI000C75C3AE|nr:SCO family protein [Bacillus sp. T33-2]PLR98888.1 cytochrome c oxidase assembly protein [Bacillus sp. T33-2]
MRRLMVLAAIAMVLGACGQKGIENPLNWPVGDFSYTNQVNQSFGLKDLEGKVWVADFIFTNCADVCPPMTANMAKLQEKVKEEELKNIEFVSFSVDPAVDTPEKLKEYAGRFHADLKNWNFLTGYEQQEIEQLAMKSFKGIVQKPAEGDQVTHVTKFYLVDQKGTIMKVYSGLNEIPYDEIINDMKALQ